MVGGFTTTTGQYLLVTPSGEAVGSAEPRLRTGSGSITTASDLEKENTTISGSSEPERPAPYETTKELKVERQPTQKTTIQYFVTDARTGKIYPTFSKEFAEKKQQENLRTEIRTGKGYEGGFTSVSGNYLVPSQSVEVKKERTQYELTTGEKLGLSPIQSKEPIYTGLKKYTMQLKPSSQIDAFKPLKEKNVPDYLRTIGYDKFSNLGRGQLKGGYEGIRQEPNKFLINLGSTAALFATGGIIGRGVIGGARFYKGTEFAIKTQKGLSSVGTAIGGLGTGAYLGYKGSLIRQEKDYYKKGEILGKTTTLELIPATIGGVGGYKITRKAYGLSRTIGKTYVNPEEIIAPEYLAGQKYPLIRKGQTAGELQKEFFKPNKAIGETTISPRMFTTASLKFDKMTTVEKGSSELIGLYGAPRASPEFAKVSGLSNYKLFGIPNLLETGSQPTIIRTNLKDLRLAPNVLPTQKTFTPLGKVKPFFYEGAEKGIGYVPFIKSEKEAILTYESLLVRTGSKYYTKIKGERVPLYQYETFRSGKTSNEIKIETTKGLSGYYYSGKKQTLFNPFTISSNYNYKISSKIYPSYSKQKSYSYKPQPSNLNIDYKSFSPSSSSKLFYYTPPPTSRRYYGYTTPKIKTPSTIIDYGGYYDPPTKRGFIYLQLPKLSTVSKTRRIKIKRKFKRQPSLIASELNIKALKPAKFEETGLIIRPLT